MQRLERDVREDDSRVNRPAKTFLSRFLWVYLFRVYACKYVAMCKYVNSE